MNKKNKKIKDFTKEEYAYDFVPELSHTVNIDEQKQTVKKLENISKKKK